MIFHCKATLNLKEHQKNLDAYYIEYDKYIDHKEKMVHDDMYRIENADVIVEEPVRPKGKDGYTKCNFKKESIVGYEVSEDIIFLIIDYSMTGNGSYIIKYDDKIIEKLDNLLE